MAMIGLPVMIICGGAALLGTADVSPREALPVSVGQAQALLRTAHGGAVEQTVDGQLVSERDRASAPVPGHVEGQPWTTAQLDVLTGGHVGVSDLASAAIGSSGPSQQGMIRVIGREVLGPSGLVDLVEGRLPQRDGEVLVTEHGVASGLPRSGSVQIATGGQSGPARVVGVARATGPDFQPVSLVGGPEWQDTEDSTRFLLVREDPVSWDDVLAWNAAGVSVLSPAVIADPPAGAPTAAGVSEGSNRALVILLAFGLVLETALLAGPAFAVSAARRTRTLALIAGNGGDHQQLVRFVTAQAVILGGVAVTLGAILGTVLGWLSLRVLAALFDSSRFTSIGRPPLDTYGWAVATIVAAAFGAAVLSALVPGLRSASRTVAPRLAGQTDRSRPARGLPVAGGVIMIAGLVLVAISLANRGETGTLVAAGTGGGLLVIGALFVIPLLVDQVGGWLAHGRVPVRMGARDVVRARSRSVPAVAAITVATAVLTMITISALSDDAQSRRDYLPSTLPGAAVVDAYGPVQATLAEVRAQHPSWSIEPAGWVGDDGSNPQVLHVSAVAPGCTPEQTIELRSAAPGPCQRHSSDNGWRVSVPATNTLNSAAQLSSDQRQAFDAGSLLVTSQDLITNGKVDLAVSSGGEDAVAARILERTVRVPAIAITAEQAAGLSYQTYTQDPAYGVVGTGIISPVGAERTGLPWRVESYHIVDPAGPISRADEQAINDRVAAPLTVERGYQSASRLILLVVLAIVVVLVLGGSMIATALTQVEGRQQSATMAALGATPGFRRRVAGMQAIMIVALGVSLGVVLGLAPGLALAATLTTDWDPSRLGPVYVIPYAELGVLIVVVPILAAGLAALMVRRDPVPTRRLT